MKRAIASLLFVAALACAAQTLEQTAGIYTPYPTPSGISTPAPEGYKPVYISHYGRHGSRWITDDKRYLATIEPFDSAHAVGGLTALGEDVHKRLQRVNADALGRSGHLTPLGAKQHHDIAQRMHQSSPEVFADSARIEAVSSTALRCALSMAAFSEGLKELNPSLQIQRSAYDKYMDYIAYTSPEGKKFGGSHGPWRREHFALMAKVLKPKRLIKSLFKNPNGIDPMRQLAIYEALYWVASDMANVDIDENFYDIFEYDELRNHWLVINSRMYACNGNYPEAHGLMLHCADGLLSNIIECADSALEGKSGLAANLRFGHDTNLLRLMARMQIDGATGQTDKLKNAHTVWRDYELSPMAANLQLIFYKSDDGPTLVKVLVNEEEKKLPIPSEISPYYEWDAVKALWLTDF